LPAVVRGSIPDPPSATALMKVPPLRTEGRIAAGRQRLGE
jgi:hypothetical protein